MKERSTANAVWPTDWEVASHHITPIPTAKIYLPFSIHVSNTCRRNVCDYHPGAGDQPVINPDFDSVGSADVFGTAAV